MRRIVVQAFSGGRILASVLALAVVWAAAQGAMAAPLELKQVAADAKWLVHVDLDAVRASTVVQKAWQQAMEKHKDAQNKMNFVTAMLGMDPTKDVHGITSYGRQIGKPAAVTIVAAAFDPQRITTLTGALPGRESSKYGDYEILSWSGKHREHKWSVSATFRGRDQLVLADSVDNLKGGLDVLDGKSAALAPDDALAGNIPAGSTFLLRVQGIAAADLHCAAPVAKHIDSFRLVSGESDGQSFLRARAVMTDADTAAAGLDVLEGWKAQAKLFCPDELGRKLVAALNPKVDGNTLTILWSASADDVWSAVGEIRQAVAKHMARHRAHGGKHGCPLCRMCGEGKCPICEGGGKDKDAPRKGKKRAAPEEDF